MLPVFVASGCWVSSFTQIYRLLSCTDIGGVMMKTATLEPRCGNAPPNFVSQADYTLNRMGLPNAGIDAYLDFAHQLRTGPYATNILGKKWGVSIAYEDGMSFSRLLQRCMDHAEAVDYVEVNMSCPNTTSASTRGVAGYNLHDIQDVCIILDTVTPDYTTNVQVGLKLPPYFDTTQLNSVAEVIARSRSISFVTSCNSIPNLMTTESTHPMAGSCSAINKSIGLSNVYRMRHILPSHVDIFGCGGIRTAKDIYEYMVVGANKVQIASGFLEHDTQTTPPPSTPRLEMDIGRINDVLSGIWRD